VDGEVGADVLDLLDKSVYEVPRATPQSIRYVMAYTGDGNIVGAGVSTCAPLF